MKIDSLNFSTAAADVINFNGLGTYAKVGTYGDQFSLVWTDGVCNEWAEVYPTLSLALARFALLVYCGESEWEKGFNHSPSMFSAIVTEFANELVS